MASPTLDLICCAVQYSIHHNISKWNASHMPDVIMSNARPYHRGEFGMPVVYNICAILSSCLSIVGAVYILLPKKAYVPRQRQSFRVVQRQRKILTWLSVADVLASVGTSIYIFILNAFIYLFFTSTDPFSNHWFSLVPSIVQT